jgi:molybdate transport repressor ModE-like protein
MTSTDGWPGLELRHLLALQAVAREGSFANAAEALGYTQSAISQQIAALERVVEQRLVERPGGRRRIWLTEAGEALLRHADAIIAHVHAAAADVEALADGRAGRLRVGTYQSVSARILPPIVKEFTQRLPDVKLELREARDDAELYGMLERAELELSFGLLPAPEGPFEAIELMRDPYVLVVAADSALADTPAPPTLAEIAELPLIGFEQCRQERWLETTLQARATRPTWVFRSDDNSTIQAMAAAGVGVAIVPELAVDRADQRTVAIELGDLLPPRRLGIVWHVDRTRSIAADAFIDLAIGSRAPSRAPGATP